MYIENNKSKMDLIYYYPRSEYLLQESRIRKNLILIMNPDEINNNFNLHSEDDAIVIYDKYDMSTLAINITYTPHFILNMKNGRLLVTFLTSSMVSLVVGSWFFPEKLKWVYNTVRFIGMFF